MLDFDTYDCRANDPFKYDKVCQIQSHPNAIRPTFYYTPVIATHNRMHIAMIYGITEEQVDKICRYKNKTISMIAIRKYYFIKESWLGKTYTEVGFTSD